jgi:hypothetical protein
VLDYNNQFKHLHQFTLTLPTKLAPALIQSLGLRTIINNHIRFREAINILSSILNHTCTLVILLWRYTSQISHYLGEMVTRIDSNSAEGVLPTLTRQTPLKAGVDNLWHNSGTKFIGPTSAALPGLPFRQSLPGL